MGKMNPLYRYNDATLVAGHPFTFCETYLLEGLGVKV